MPGVEHIVGDRDPAADGALPRALPALAGRDFDAVVDFSGYLPRVVAAALDALDRVPYTLFVSSISAYVEGLPPGADESAPLHDPPAPEVEEITGETYGGLEVACERVVQDRTGGDCLLLRPGLIVGPRDPTDRFTWWPVRVAAGGAVLAPGPAEQPTQFIDARDLAGFVLGCLEQRRTGAVDGTGRPVALGEVLAACRDAAGYGAGTPVWTAPAWLEAEGVRPWSELPLWVGTDPDNAGFGRRDTARARAWGLRTRPLAETVRDTLAWARAVGKVPGEMAAGMDPARESALLARRPGRAAP
jgi:2'-hydroxyisoflavone reductase